MFKYDERVFRREGSRGENKMKYRISVELESVHQPRIAFAIMLSMAFLMGAGLSFAGPARADHQHPDMRDPILHVTVYSLDSNHILLDWDPFFIGYTLEYTLIYRETTQTGFDLNTPWKDTRVDFNPYYHGVVPGAKKWLDEDVNDPNSVQNYKEECYYIVRINFLGPSELGPTSNTAGKWTHTFDGEYDDWTLPFDYYPGIDYSQPGWVNTVEEYRDDMGADRIGWIEGGYWQYCYPLDICPKEVMLGEGFTASFDGGGTHYYTFVGQPGAQLDYWDLPNPATPTFDPEDTAGMIDAEVNGHDVTITWEHIGADEYCVYYSNSRIGVFGLEDLQFWRLGCVIPGVGITHLDVAYPGTELYYWVRPYTDSGSGLQRGNPTYTIGVWTSDWEPQDYASLPLKPYDNYAYVYYRPSYYCTKIPNMFGFVSLMNMYWKLHVCGVMPPGVYDPYWEMINGVQTISDGPAYFSHTGM